MTFQLKQMYLSSDLKTHLDLGPGSGGEITIGTLEGVWIQVRPLVVLHVGASVERLHADPAGKPLGAQTRRACSRGRGRSFTAQLSENKQHGQRGQILSVVVVTDLHMQKQTAVTSTCCRTPSGSADVR